LRAKFQRTFTDIRRKVRRIMRRKARQISLRKIRHDPFPFLCLSHCGIILTNQKMPGMMKENGALARDSAEKNRMAPGDNGGFSK